MIIMNSSDKEFFTGLSEVAEKATGMKYFSPSSFNDMDECGLKLKYRKMYRSTSLYTLLGNSIHGLLELVGLEIKRLVEMEKKSFTEAINSITIEYLLGLRPLVKEDVIGSAQLKVVLGELDADVDKPFIEDIEFMDALFTKVLDLVDLDVVKALITRVPIGAEIAGFKTFHNKYLFYGIIDLMSTEGRTLYIDDYKTVWSSASKTNWLKTSSTFQTWIYKHFAEEYAASSGKYDNVEVAVKLMHFNSPVKKLKKGDITKADILAHNTKLTVLTRQMDFTKLDVAKFESRMKANFFLYENNLLKVAESKFGCNYCFYQKHCEHHLKTGEGKACSS